MDKKYLCEPQGINVQRCGRRCIRMSDMQEVRANKKAVLDLETDPAYLGEVPVTNNFAGQRLYYKGRDMSGTDYLQERVRETTHRA